MEPLAQPAASLRFVVCRIVLVCNKVGCVNPRLVYSRISFDLLCSGLLNRRLVSCLVSTDKIQLVDFNGIYSENLRVT
jgi:hypothetical protein